MYHMSQDGLQALIRFEGYKSKPYRDSISKLTIGVGHLLTQEELQSGLLEATGTPWHDGISAETISAVLSRDLKHVESQLSFQRLYQHEFDALCSWAFNVGTKAATSSTLAKCLHQSRYAQVPIELHKWVRAGGSVVPGLVNRRKAEAYIFSEGKYDTDQFFR